VGFDEAAIEGLGRMILAGGVQQLAVDDRRADEVAGLTWSGNPVHLRSVAAALDRAAQGLEDYLVVRAPAGEPVAKMRVDYASEDDTGVFSQLATMDPAAGPRHCDDAHRSGRAARPCPGLAVAALGVEDDNPRARPLYERLGIPGARSSARIMGVRGR